MKHLFFALLYFFATVATAQTLSEYPDFERYQKDNERIIQNKTYPKVIFIGNSILSSTYKCNFLGADNKQ